MNPVFDHVPINRPDSCQADIPLRFYGTLGPSCADLSVLRQMQEAGMTGIRINLSHGSLQKQKERVLLLENLQKANPDFEILIDLKGRELRLKDCKEREVEQDSPVFLEYDLLPDSFSSAQFPAGTHILIDDGKLLLEVQSTEKTGLWCQAKNSGRLLPRKSIKILDVPSLPWLPALAEEDIENLQAAQEFGITGVMVPFVQSAGDVIKVREELSAFGENLKILAKIEDHLGAAAIEEIAGAADEIVLARGDLANDVSIIRLPHVVHQLSRKLNQLQKPYMVVTQMLDSMHQNPAPTRAEVSDIFYAVYHGASSIMLTGETAVGNYPLEAMQIFCQVGKLAWEQKEKESADLQSS